MPETDELSIRVSADTRPAQNALSDLARQADGFSSAITHAFKDAIVGGKDFEAVLKGLALRIAGMALDSALKPVGNAIGGLFRAIGLANGGVIGGGQVKRFAEGGVVATPTFFPLSRGLGLLGKSGAEAVLPLSRGSDGKLGVRTEAGAPVVVNFHISTPDADSFRKSEAQVTSMLARAVGRGRRGL